MLLIVLTVVVVLLSIIYFLLTLNNDYWKKRGVPGPTPTLLAGNLGWSFLLRKPAGEVYRDIYEKYKDSPLVGIFRATSPTILAIDPDFVKDVTVKEFSSFHDNDIYADEKIDPILGKHPFVLKGERWKTVRTQITPCFTSGKMKALYPLLEDMAERLAKFVADQPEAFNGSGLDLKEICTRFTLNNVARCAFGIEGQCFEEKNSKFRDLARRFMSPGTWATTKMLFIFQFPALSKWLSLKFVSADVEEELTQMVTATLKYREEHNIVRNDFMYFMTELRNTSKDHKFTNLDITAQAAAFFSDGYETSSLVMHWLLYALANNPDKQAILRREINDHFEKNGGRLPYDVLLTMPYLEAVYNETLRLYPAVFMLSKKCTSNYTYVPKDDCLTIKKPFTIEEGTTIILPLLALQHDERYYDNPESFIPARFLPENKDRLTKYTFLPLGEGPRACLGQRFGALQIKVGIVHMVRNYELSVNPKTQTPIKFDPLYFMTAAVGGLWADLKKIDNVN